MLDEIGQGQGTGVRDGMGWSKAASLIISDVSAELLKTLSLFYKFDGGSNDMFVIVNRESRVSIEVNFNRV